MSLASQHKKTVLSHGEPRDAAVNFDIELYNKSIMEHLRTLNTATLSTRTHPLAPKPAKNTMNFV